MPRCASSVATWVKTKSPPASRSSGQPGDWFARHRPILVYRRSGRRPLSTWLTRPREVAPSRSPHEYRPLQAAGEQGLSPGQSAAGSGPFSNGYSLTTGSGRQVITLGTEAFLWFEPYGDPGRSSRRSTPIPGSSLSSIVGSRCAIDDGPSERNQRLSPSSSFAPQPTLVFAVPGDARQALARSQQRFAQDARPRSPT